MFRPEDGFHQQRGWKSRELWHTSGLSGLTLNTCCNDLRVWISLLYDQIVLPSGLNPHEYIGYIFIKLFGIQFYFFPFAYLSRCFFLSFSGSVSLSFLCRCYLFVGAAWRRGLCNDVYKGINMAPGISVNALSQYITKKLLFFPPLHLLSIISEVTISRFFRKFPLASSPAQQHWFLGVPNTINDKRSESAETLRVPLKKALLSSLGRGNQAP